MLIFKALHILSMFTMVAIFLGGEFFYTAAYWRRDVHALAWVHRTGVQTRVPIVGLAALLVGVVFGLLTAATGGFDFFKGWLIAAYVLVVAFLLNWGPAHRKDAAAGTQSGRGGRGEARHRRGPARHGRQPCGLALLPGEHRDLCGDHPGHGAEAVLTTTPDPSFG